MDEDVGHGQRFLEFMMIGDDQFHAKLAGGLRASSMLAMPQSTVMSVRTPRWARAGQRLAIESVAFGEPMRM